MKRVSTIAYNPPESGSTNTGGRDAFIFSEDIEKWMHAKTLSDNRKAREKAPKGPGRITRANHLKQEDL